MAWKFVVVLAYMLTIANSLELQGGHILHAYSPVLVKMGLAEAEGPVEYSFTYSVNDPTTGDIKSQKESRKGDRVEGSYELIDSDGFKRLVQYTADDHSGFQAEVQRQPTDIKIPLPETRTKPLKALIAPITPLVHYAPISKLITQNVGRVEAPSKGNQVTFSAPSVSYNY